MTEGARDVYDVTDQLALSVSYQKSPENGLIQFGLGFRIDQ